MPNRDRHPESLARKREPAIRVAWVLLARSDYLRAIAAIRRVDDSIDGIVATARLLEAHLQELVSRTPAADRASIRAAFEQAWRVYYDCYPDPHTQLEADDFDRGRADDRARL